MYDLEVNHFFSFVGDSVPEKLENRFFKVTNKEPFYYETGRTDTAEFNATVAFGSNSGFRNIEVLEPHDSHLLGVDWGVKDGGRYQMKMPTGSDRLGLDEDMDVGFVTNELSPWIAPDPVYGFWLVQTLYPAFQMTNDAPKTITPKIYFRGLKLSFEEVGDAMLNTRLNSFKQGKGGQPFFNVMIGGVGE